MNAGQQPFVSVVVPARDEERSLDPCLASITAQHWPADRLQVVVVENGSRDRTRAVAEAWAAGDPRVGVVVSQAANHAEAMNAGIRAARGEIVARVDAHSYVDRGYVAEVVAAFDRHPEAAAVGGAFLPAGETLRERVAGLARSSRLGVGGGYGADRLPHDHPVRSVQCGAYRREALLAVGGFDPAMAYGEDEELNWRLRRRGFQVMLCPTLRQLYRPRASLAGLWRQYWNYGRGRMRVLRKHPDFLAPRHLAPSALVVALGGLAAAGTVLPAAHAALALVAGAWGAVLAGASCAARGARWRERLLLPCAVAGMHLAYGAGLLREAGGGNQRRSRAPEQLGSNGGRAGQQPPPRHPVRRHLHQGSPRAAGHVSRVTPVPDTPSRGNRHRGCQRDAGLGCGRPPRPEHAWLPCCAEKLGPRAPSPAEPRSARHDRIGGRLPRRRRRPGGGVSGGGCTHVRRRPQQADRRRRRGAGAGYQHREKGFCAGERADSSSSTRTAAVSSNGPDVPTMSFRRARGWRSSSFPGATWPTGATYSPHCASMNG